METRFAKFVLMIASVVLIHVTPSFGQSDNSSEVPPAFVQKVEVHVNGELFYKAQWEDGPASTHNPDINRKFGPPITRKLVPSKSKPLPKKGDALVTVSFSQAVKKVNMNFRFVRGEIVPKRNSLARKVWRSKFDISKIRSEVGGVARVPLLISAENFVHGREFDGDPGTIPKWDPKTKKWQRVEEGQGDNYWVSLRKGNYSYETESLWRVGPQLEYDESVDGKLDGKYMFPILFVPEAYQIEATLKKLKGMNGFLEKFQIKDLSGFQPRDKPFDYESLLSSIKRSHTIQFTNNLGRTAQLRVELVNGKAKEFNLRVRLIDRGDLGTHTDAGDISPGFLFGPVAWKKGLDILWNKWQTANLFGNDTVDYFRLPNLPKGTSVWVEIRNPVYYEFYAGGKKTISGSSINVRMQEEIFTNGKPKITNIDKHPRVWVDNNRKKDQVRPEFFRTSQPCNIWFKVEAKKANANVSYQIRVHVVHSIGLPGSGN